MHRSRTKKRAESREIKAQSIKEEIKVSSIPACFMTEGIALDCHLFGDVLPVNALERAIVDDGQQQVFIRLVVPQGGARARHLGWIGGERCWMKGELVG